MATENMNAGELRRAVAELVDAIDTICANWQHGDLAEAVNAAEACADTYRVRTESDDNDEQPRVLLALIRDVVLAKFPGADYVTIGTEEWDNGYFFSFGLVQVSTRGGNVASSEVLNQLRNWEGDLTDDFGPVGRDSRLLINLESLETEFV